MTFICTSADSTLSIDVVENRHSFGFIEEKSVSTFKLIFRSIIYRKFVSTGDAIIYVCAAFRVCQIISATNHVSTLDGGVFDNWSYLQIVVKSDTRVNTPWFVGEVNFLIHSRATADTTGQHFMIRCWTFKVPLYRHVTSDYCSWLIDRYFNLASVHLSRFYVGC